MPHEIYPGVFVPDTPKTEEYRDSRADGYVTLHTAKRYENFKLSLEQAGLEIKDQQQQYATKLKVAERMVSGIDDEIKALNKIQYDLSVGAIRADEAAQARNVAALNSTNRFNVSQGNQALNRQAAAEQKSLAYTTVDTSKLSSDELGKLTHKVGAGGDQISPSDIVGKLQATYTKASGSDKLDGTHYDQHVVALRADDLAKVSDPTVKAEREKQWDDVLTGSGITRDIGDPNRFVVLGTQTTVPAVTGAKPGQEQLAGAPILTGTEKEKRAQLQAQYLLDLKDAQSRRQSALDMETMIPTADTDLIGRARSIYGDRFEANRPSRTLPDENRQSYDRTKSVIESFISVAMAHLPIDASQDDRLRARTDAIQQALIALDRSAGHLKPSTVAAVSPAGASQNSSPSIPPQLKTPFNVIDKDFKSQSDPYLYTYNPNDDTYTVISGPSSVGAKFGPRTDAYQKLHATGISLSEDDTKNPPEAQGMTFQKTIGSWAHATGIDATPFIVKPAEPDVPAPSSFTDPADTIDIAPAAPVRIPAKNPTDTMEFSPSKPTIDRSFDPFKGRQLKAIPASKLSSSDVDRQGRVQSAIAASQLVQTKPNRVDRLAKNTSYGRTVKGIFDAVSGDFDRDFAGSTKKVQDAVIKHFAGDPETQRRAMELAQSMVLLQDRSSKMG